MPQSSCCSRFRNFYFLINFASMNVNVLISRFFSGTDPYIEVFDQENVYAVYLRLQKALRDMPDIELSILQALAYCFYEVMDNVLVHSGKPCGTVMMEYLPDKKRIKILVADDGMGIRASLSQNPQFSDISEETALLSCIEDKVTSGNGMGFGLYSTAKLVKDAGTMLLIHSGNHCLTYNDGIAVVKSGGKWQGTIVFFELFSDKEINPDAVVDNRTSIKEQYNETFLDNQDIFDELW